MNFLYKNTSLCFLSDYNSLEVALKESFGISGSWIKKKFLNKKLLLKKVKKGEIFEFPLDVVNKRVIYPEYNGAPIDVLYSDEHVLVLDKPCDVHCHPLSYCESDNCLSFLRQNGYFNELLVNSEKYDRGLLFRLDYATSGVLFYIKSEKLYFKLRASFNDVVKLKRYLAVVEGNLQNDGPIINYLKGSGPKRSEMTVFSESVDDSIQAKLSVKKLDYNSEHDLSLLEVDLVTGVRHQIRAQLGYLGHPILGDTLYGGKTYRRLFLHALSYSVQFENLSWVVKSNRPELFDLFFDLDSCL